MLSDIEIAQAAKMQPITEIAANLGLQGEDVIPYGHYKAKLNHKLAKADKPEGKLINPTKPEKKSKDQKNKKSKKK